MTKDKTRQPQGPGKTPDDLDENPGIGQSKGLFARAGSKDADLIEGENTIEGDRENDAGLGGGAGPKGAKIGR